MPFQYITATVQRLSTAVQGSRSVTTFVKPSAEVEQDLQLARVLQNSAKYAEALVLLERASSRQPASAALLQMRGRCLEAVGNVPAAFASYMAALSIEPGHLPTLLGVGGIYKSRGMLLEALHSYTQAYELQPNDTATREALAVVLTDIGTKLKGSGDLADSLAKYRSAVELCPTYAPAYYNMGVVFSEMRQLDEALLYYQKAVTVQPQYTQAHCNMGVIYKERGELEAAILCYERALVAAPNFGIVQSNLAIALTDMGTKVKMEGRVADGITLYERALAHNPRYADALYNLGVVYGETGQQHKAILMYELAVHFNPQCAEAYNNLGVIHKERDNMERAVECYSAGLSIRPNFPQGLNNLAVIYTSQGRVQEALALLTAAIQACPAYAEAHNNLGVLQRDVGAIREAIASYTRCLDLQPDSRNAGQNRLLALNYIHPGEEPAVCAAHAEWGEAFQRLHPALPPLDIKAAEAAAAAATHPASTSGSAAAVPVATSDPNSMEGESPASDISTSGSSRAGEAAVARFLHLERQLVVGYLSPDMFTHSVSYFAEAPLAHHRPDKVHHIVYSCVPRPDAKTAHLRSVVERAGGTWRDVAKLTEADLALLIREDKVDVLVELTGHTANNRLGAVARRPAPIQVTWIGYPNSTGLRAVDYRFTDTICDPEDTAQTFVEELVRLPGCFLCYTPALDAPPVAALPALANGFITFGSFNNLAKITAEVIRVWAQVLHRVPRSRLVLKNKPFVCASARAHVHALLSAEGVEPWRVDLLPLAHGNAQHLATYCAMDISLDPFPYAGTTTTCESLYMGVPCITLAGGCHAHNVGVSLLAALGIAKDWVTTTTEEYVELAVRHASDVPALAELRQTLRTKMLASPLCDAPAFTARLEGTYRSLWHRYVAAQQSDKATLDHNEPAAKGIEQDALQSQSAAPAMPDGPKPVVPRTLSDPLPPTTPVQPVHANSMASTTQSPEPGSAQAQHSSEKGSSDEVRGTGTLQIAAAADGVRGTKQEAAAPPAKASAVPPLRTSSRGANRSRSPAATLSGIHRAGSGGLHGRSHTAASGVAKGVTGGSAGRTRSIFAHSGVGA